MKKVGIASYLRQEMLYSKPKEPARIGDFVISYSPIVWEKGGGIKIECGELAPADNVVVLSGGFIVRTDFSVGVYPGTRLIITDIDEITLINIRKDKGDWNILELDRVAFIKLLRAQSKLSFSLADDMRDKSNSSFRYFFDDFEFGQNDVEETVSINLVLSPTKKNIFLNEKRHSIQGDGSSISFVCSRKGNKKAKKEFFNRISTAVEFLADGLDELGATFDVVVVHKNSLKEVYRIKSKDNENTEKDETE